MFCIKFRIFKFWTFQKYLMTLNTRLDQLSGSENHDTVQEQNSFESDIIEDFLAELFGEDNGLSVSDKELSDSLLGEIIKLETRPKVNITAVRSIDGTTRSANTFHTQPCSSVETEQSTPICVTVPFDIVDYWKKKKTILSKALSPRESHSGRSLYANHSRTTF